MPGLTTDLYTLIGEVTVMLDQADVHYWRMSPSYCVDGTVLYEVVMYAVCEQGENFCCSFGFTGNSSLEDVRESLADALVEMSEFRELEPKAGIPIDISAVRGEGRLKWGQEAPVQ